MEKINFIPREVILHFHQQIIQLYGGVRGRGDKKLLGSALEQPKTSYDGISLHETIFDMAAAYGFHLCQNHPFLDGNKRIALVAMDTFLQANGYEIVVSEKEIFKLIMALSEGNISKQELSAWIKDNSKSI